MATRTGPDSRRRILAVLCCTEITSWGILYYAFPVLLPAISADTGWSGSAVSGAFSAGQVLAACLGFFVGRLVDRRGPRMVMTSGSVIGVAGMLLVAAAPSLVLLFVGWLVVGLACAGTLYLPAFAAITKFFGDRRIRALTALTVVGGFASTVFAPLTGLLASHLPWRTVMVILAVLLGVVTIPLHLYGLPSASAVRPSPLLSAALGGVCVARGVDGWTVGEVVTSRAFLTLALAMSAGGFVVVATVVQLVPTLGEWGVGAATAAVLLGLVGVGQVLGRVAFGPLARRSGAVAQTTGVLAAAGVVPMLILVPGGVAMGAALCLMLGLVRGVLTMVGATAVPERWGIGNYGAINGMLTTPVDLARAVAPWGGAALASWLGSFRLLFVAAAVIGMLAALVSLASLPAKPQRTAPIS